MSQFDHYVKKIALNQQEILCLVWKFLQITTKNENLRFQISKVEKVHESDMIIMGWQVVFIQTDIYLEVTQFDCV